jgi:3-hydroxybutyryl-CoA dehydrogenase
MQLSDIKTIGVVGGGTMGFGIAINFALWGYPTIISDLNNDTLAGTRSNIAHALRLFVEGGLITQSRAEETLARITTTTDLAQLAGQSDFVTEAIVERLPDKQAMFKRLDELCPPHTILASNTSRLVLSDIGVHARRQDKLVLTHYFAPPHIVPGLEVAKGPGASDETFDLTCELLRSARKIPIRVRGEKSGYLINRIQHAMAREASQLWAEGMASAEDIELGIVSTFGFRMPHEGPFLHYDLAGIWKWPEDARNPRAIENEKLRAQMLKAQPWFLDPDDFEEAVERRDREYIRRLKELYWEEDD